MARKRLFQRDTTEMKAEKKISAKFHWIHIICLMQDVCHGCSINYRSQLVHELVENFLMIYARFMLTIQDNNQIIKTY